MVDGIYIFFSAIGAWFVLLYVLVRLGVIRPAPVPEEGVEPRPAEDARPPPKEQRISLFGPFMMLKTVKGRALIERLSKWRGLRVLGDFYVILIAVTMVGITFLLIWTATLVANIPAGSAPAPEALIGLPGVNPFIPLTYGIFALVVAVVIHEFSHGVLARRWKVAIRSLGVLLFIVPIGAFVEPEEEELKALDKRKRGTVYAAGPGSNMITAFIMALIFSLAIMGAVQAKAPGMGITRVVAESPADATGLSEGMIILAINGTPVMDGVAFSEVLQQFSAGEVVSLSIFHDGTTEDRELTLANRFDFTGVPEDEGRAYVGVTTVSTNPDIYNPFESSKRLGWAGAFFAYILLPFQGLSPIQPPTTSFYEVTGPLGALPSPVFWIIANAVYWVFWISLMLGMTNALPAVPLDGGYLFRDWIDSGIKRMKAGMRAEDREKAARNVSYIVALFILALILWQLIGPRI